MLKQPYSFPGWPRFMFVLGNSVFWLVFFASANSRADDQTVPPLHASLNRPLVLPDATRRSRTAADRWRKFDAEFGIRQPHPSPVLRPIQSAKYELDATLFAVEQWVDELEDSLSFEYRQGRWQSVAALEARREKTVSGQGFLGNPRVKLDINPRPGQPYLGVRVVIPFGN